MSLNRDLVIGLDSSTTACKAVVWDLTGNVIAIGRASQPMLRPQVSWHEQPAESWWESAVQALREAVSQIDSSRLATLAISTQRETFVPVGEDAAPLRNALLWMDERARPILPQIDQTYGKQRIHQETGKPLSANLTLGKLVWLREYEPAVFARIWQVQDVHAYLAGKLTGRFVTAWGCADPTGLFDMRNNTWDTALIESIGLRVEQFPVCVPSGSLVGTVTPHAAEQTGLPAGLPLFAGLGDGQAAGLGVHVTQPGDAYLSLGTSVVSGTFTQEYLTDPAFRTMYSGVPGAYIYETVLLGGTYTISWFIERFYQQNADASAENPPEAVMDEAAATIPPGAQGLMLVPYWNSAMNPYWDAGASGVVVGWRGIHGLPHLYRAILEGIAFEQRLHTSGVEAALQRPIQRFIAVGGGARSDLWCQIIADVAGRLVYRADAPEASALGAGILAAWGAGLFPDVHHAANAMTRIAPQPFTPNPELHSYYTRLYNEVYCHLFPSLQTYIDRLTELTE